jgi:sugar diacid utilization regulator
LSLVPPPSTPERSAGPPLSRVVEALGPEIVELLVMPPGGDVEVLGPRIFEPGGPSAIGPGDVVLAVNVATTSEDDGPTTAATLPGLIETSAGAGAAAVAVKSPPPSAVDLARRAGVALLGVEVGVTWDQFHTLLHNAVAANVAAVPAGEAVPLGDLFALANAVAAMVGGAVTIEDPQSNVLAHSSLGQPLDEPRRVTILERRVPESWARRLEAEGIFRKLWSSPGVVRFEDPAFEARPRLAAAIRAGSEPLGSIWVLEGDDHPLGPEAEQALIEAARVAALHVLRHRASEDLDRRERGALLRALLDGQAPAGDSAARLGIEPNQPCAVLGFRLLITDDAELDFKRARAVDLITVYCEAFRRRAACTSIGRDVYVLLPSLGPDARVLPLARDIADHAAAALGTELIVGVGSTVATVDLAPVSCREADRVLRALEGPATASVAHIDEVRVRSIVMELAEILRGRPDLHLPELDQLAARAPSYVDTLRAYLDAFGDISAAAEAMNLHPNSFRYRLRRLREMANLDIDDPDTRLVAGLLLRLGDRS